MPDQSLLKTQGQVTCMSELAKKAEEQFLGAILTCNGRKEFSESKDIIKSDDFWVEQYRIIFRAMSDIFNLTSEPINQISVAHEIARGNNFKTAMCAELSILIANCYSCLDYVFYAREIKSFSNQRKGIQEKRFISGRGGVIV